MSDAHLVTCQTAAKTAVDLFSGSGAVTAALRGGGYRVLAAVDKDPVACTTFQLNHPTTLLIQKDITTVDPEQLASQLQRSIDLLAVCAPCQPFSSHRRGHLGDPRAELLLEAIRFAQVLRPAAILFENVPGLARPGNEGILRRLKEGLANAGYSLSRIRKIDAAELGVPQRRLRCVMVASRRREALDRFEAEKLSAPRRTVRQTISHLEPLASGSRSRSDPLHFARTHSELVLRRLAHISADGGSRSELPDELLLACHRGRSRSYSDVYGRMSWDDVAPTLTTGCTDLTRGRYAHPDQDRAITLREAALLQTFPPDYLFHGCLRQITTQIGNAVPVAMVERMLPAIDRLVRAQNG